MKGIDMLEVVLYFAGIISALAAFLWLQEWDERRYQKQLDLEKHINTIIKD